MNAPSRRDVSVATIALAMLAAAGKAQGQQSPATGEAPLSDEQIRALLAQRIDRDRESVGMVVGLIGAQGRRIVSHGVFGLADKRPVAGDTIFGVASVTKAFIGLLLVEAVRRKEVKLDDPVSRYLPASVRLPERGGRAITLVDLATHTVGLPHDLPDDLRAVASKLTAPEARAVMYDFLARSTLPADIGTAWSYSNLDYTLIGFALEARTGLDYETLVRTRITGPLGMADTGVSVSPAQWERRARPHTAELAASPEWNKPWSVSVLQSTANDMLSFLGAAMGLSKTPLSASFADMLAVRRPAPSLGRGAEQALGWYVHPFDGRPLIAHSGSGGGFGATAMYDPAARLGVVLLSNAESLWEDVARNALRPSLPLAVKKTGIALPDAVLDGYVGRYLAADGGAYTVVREASGLILRPPQGYRVPLTADSETHFTVQGFPTLFIDFQRDAGGRPTGLTWTFGGAATPARWVAE
jgi:D-alanyl-D-alanine-carboxypeptidase/D-alanyl-D-alanine-endopeptidase